MIPLTAYKGIVLPGLYNFDGHCLGWLYKRRVKYLFRWRPWHESLTWLPWHEIGLNVYMFPWHRKGFYFRKGVLDFIHQQPGYRVQIWEVGPPDYDPHNCPVRDWVLKGEEEASGVREFVDMPQTDDTTLMVAVIADDGSYIGNPDTALMLLRRGIVPEKRTEESNSASIGWSAKEHKWYGWSHRAIYGFTVGDIIDSSDHICTQSGWTDEYLDEHPEADDRLPVGFVAQTLDDAKKMACSFASGVA